MRAIWLGFLGVFAGLAVLAIWTCSPAASPAPDRAALPITRPAAAASPVTAPAARSPAPPQMMSAASARPGAMNREPAPRDPDEFRAQQLAHQRERIALRERLDQRIRSEPRDERWAHQVEADVSSSVAALHAGAARIAALECRATLCSIVLEHPGPDLQSDAMMALAGKPGFKLPGKAHLEYRADGTAATYIYLSRSGSFFPAL